MGQMGVQKPPGATELVMGIYGALSTAVTGLKAQSFALENISGNIANSQTTGYKRMETSFVDLIPDAPLKSQVPGAVLAYSRSTNDVQGDVNTASTGTFMALNGSGFFMVEPPAGQSDGQPVFSGQSYYTRRGDFSIDKNGYLVNGSGYYLKGLPIDANTGNVSGSVPGVIKLSNSFLPAHQTTGIDYRLNLPQLPKNPNYQNNLKGSELLNPGSFGIHGISTATANGATIADPTVDAAPAVVKDGETLAITIAGTTRTYEFDTDGTVGDGNIAIDATAGKSIADILQAIQQDLRDNGPAEADNATVSAASGKVQVTLGSNMDDTIGIADETTGLGLVSQTYKPDYGAAVAVDNGEVDRIGVRNAGKAGGGIAARGIGLGRQVPGERWRKQACHLGGLHRRIGDVTVANGVGQPRGLDLHMPALDAVGRQRAGAELGEDIEQDEGGDALAVRRKLEDFVAGIAGGDGVDPVRSHAGQVLLREKAAPGLHRGGDLACDFSLVKGLGSLAGDLLQGCP